MFLLKNGNEGKIPKLSFTNVSFLNFYAIKKEGGWKTLIYLIDSYAKTIRFVNFTISNFFFLHGILFDIIIIATIPFERMNEIIIENVLIENFTVIFNQNYNNKKGLFNFQNLSPIFISITNLTIHSMIISSTSPIIYFFLLESSAFHSPESELYINGLTFENNTDIGFIYVNAFLKITINDFIFKNISSTKETSLFALFFTNLPLILNNGLLYDSFYEYSLFLCQKITKFILNSIKVNNLYGNLVNCSDSAISISDSQFENIEANYLILMSSNSNILIVNSNFSSLIFNQAAFYLSDVSNLSYNASWFINISTTIFVFFKSNNFELSTHT